ERIGPISAGGDFKRIPLFSAQLPQLRESFADRRPPLSLPPSQELLKSLRLYDRGDEAITVIEPLGLLLRRADHLRKFLLGFGNLPVHEQPPPYLSILPELHVQVELYLARSSACRNRPVRASGRT